MEKDQGYKERWNIGWMSALNRRDWPEFNFKSGSQCKQITKKSLLNILGDPTIKLDSNQNLANFLAYLALKSKDVSIIDLAIQNLDKIISKNTSQSYTEQILYGFKKSYKKKITNTLNMGLRKRDLKDTTPEMKYTAMLYIKGYINNRMKTDDVNAITLHECINVYTGAMLPYYDEISVHILRGFITDVLEAAKAGIPFSERPKPRL